MESAAVLLPPHRSTLDATISKLQALALQSDVPPHRIADGLEVEVDSSAFHEADPRSWTPEIDSSGEPIFSFLNASAEDALPPRSPTQHSRRLTASTPDELRSNIVLPSSPFSSIGRQLGVRTSSDGRHSSSASSGLTPFSARSTPGMSFSGSPEDVDHAQELEPFFPQLPRSLSIDTEAQQVPAPFDRTASSPSISSARSALTSSASQRKKNRHHAALANSHSNLLQLASLPSSFGFLGAAASSSSSVPSSAGSSCPASPDLVSLQQNASGSSLSPLPQLDNLVLHTPESPTWKPATLAHQSGMELSQLRRAREAFKGKDSVARMKLIGQSSRAKEAQQQQQQQGGSPAAHLRRDFDYDSSGVSDCETPSPIHTPTSFTRHRLPQTLSHRVKPLMSSHGHLQMQALMYSGPPPPSLPSLTSDPQSFATAPPSLLATVPLNRVDPELVMNYLRPLDQRELVATIQPIRALLPISMEDTAVEVTASPTSSSSSSSVASPSIPFSIASIPSFSNLHLSLLLCRCIARSHWRKTIPLDLLQLSLECLDLTTMLTQVTRVSKYWRGGVKDLMNHAPVWQQEVLRKQAEVRRRQKLKLYRRLTPADLQLASLLDSHAT